MSFTSIPVRAYDKTNQKLFFLLLKCFYVETVPKENKTILSTHHTILKKLYVGNVYNRQ